MGQAIPSYCRSTFLLPKSLADELQKIMNSFWWGTRANGERRLNWFRWDRLCDKKGEGAIGFRSLRDFNLAMLGKQGWKVIMNPDSLIVHVFKARYFRDKDYHTTQLGLNPSFSWEGIWNAQPIISYGVWWRIGNGTKIRVWHDPRIRGGTNFRVETPTNPMLAHMTVNDLWIPGVREWDIALLDDLFSEQDARAIAGIPLSNTSGEF